MNIGIDIDDTITDTFEYLIDIVADYFHLDAEYLRKNNISYSNLPEECRPYQNEFGLKTYAGLLRKIPVKQGAIEYIKKLKDEGHNIFIITARDNRIYDHPYEATKDQMDFFGVYYDKIVCTFDKRTACIENNIDVFIDDSINNLNSISDLNIEPILYTSVLNKDTEFNGKRVNNWKETFEYITQKHKI